MPSFARQSQRGWRLVGLLTLAAGVTVLPGCPRNSSTSPVRDTRDTVSLSGFVGVLYLNRTRYLIQPAIRFDYAGESPFVNVDNITPESWEALIVGCGMDSLTPLGLAPFDTDNDIQGENIEFTSGSLTTGDQIGCGSLIVIDVSQGATDDLNDLVVNISTRPESFSGVAPRTSATAPGDNVDLILFYNLVEFETQATLTYSWEDDRGLVYAPQLLVQPGGLPIGGLLECPIEQIGVGNVADANVPVITIDDEAFEVARPDPLVMDQTVHCGDTVLLKADVADDGAVSLTMEASSEGADLPNADFDLFGNIRQIIDDEGFAGRQSNVRFLSGN